MTLPTLSCTRKLAYSVKWKKLEHYLVAPYASIEPHFQNLVIVDPSLTEPTWLLRAGTRKVSRRNIVALLLPTLDHLTLELAQSLTHMVTDYIGIRETPADGTIYSRLTLHPSELPLIAEKITAQGPVWRGNRRPAGCRPAA
ncbi:hypothetical protein [Gordonia sihwensis]|uniref:hypothetical protein n=1 Tax=Gordonia sihwensis TaxID=173559 RepID=UPI0005EDD84A|nr:hypothetical protein [Gordonia sihwensis]KJR10566.1 hypothetical protein UG54_00840 [Gordonia sihwensis]